MNSILLKKDLRHHAGELLFVMACELGLVLSLGAQIDNLNPQVLLTLAFGISFIAGFVLSFRMVASEDGATGMAFLLSLPVTRREIVVAKFAATWLLSLTNFLVVWGSVLLYCLAREDSDMPDVDNIVTFVLLQLFSSSFYLSCAILFNSSRAIWLPFPLLVVGINLAVNWSRIAAHLPGLPAVLPVLPLLLAAASPALLWLTVRVFERSPVRHEWS
ncbi:ABC transporter permease [Herbaspirillum sp. SJZ107]|uniref:ABC transporter permease n=1 Tax=Herbaspirillum sp. SJZ107 TaxID=2572881 RepID=UPI00114E59BC|nr:ABC-2 transporter permease [Herbaspirillum sp. SJZ107]TQK03376.1 ABC-2 family transporter [Herbaspirillum sp. SJZ107]